MISVRNLNVVAGVFQLKDVSFTVPSGAYAVLMGKTGSGKTTLLEAVCGLKRVQSGSIYLRDRNVTHLPPGQRGIGYVPQDLALFPTLTVCDHLAFALKIRRWRWDLIKDRVAELAGMLGITHLLDRKPRGLSGGESQRVALGRALSFQPRILLLDEPLSALDEDTRADMISLLRSVQKLTGVTTLHITHSLTEAQKLADKLLRIRDGVVEEGEHQRSSLEQPKPPPPHSSPSQVWGQENIQEKPS